MSHSFGLYTFLSLFNATAGVGRLPLSDPDWCFWVTHDNFLDISRWDLINKLIQLTSVKKLKCSTLRRGFASYFLMEINRIEPVLGSAQFQHFFFCMTLNNDEREIIFSCSFERHLSFTPHNSLEISNPGSMELEIESMRRLFLFGMSKDVDSKLVVEQGSHRIL